VFTHFRLTLTILKQEVPVGVQPPGEGQYWPLGRIGEAGLPTLFAKVVRAVMRDDDD
jgi:A/G-specific adenine glycosylase